MPKRVFFKNEPNNSGDQINYEDLVGVENPARYRKGGYHPVNIGDLIQDRYRVVHKLGFGTYSTVWLAFDKDTSHYVAIKVAAGYSNPVEMNIIVCVQTSRDTIPYLGTNMIPPILDAFDLTGPNGEHSCYVMEPAGASLELAKSRSHKGLFPLGVARAMAAQLVIAVAHVHEKGYVHGDLGLRNILLQLPFNIHKYPVAELYTKFGEPQSKEVIREDKQALSHGVPAICVQPIDFKETSDLITLPQARIILTDFGEAYMPCVQNRFGSNAPSHCEPPEARWETDKPLNFSADIWGLACCIWEIVGWRPLFKSYYSAHYDVTCEQVSVLGRLPTGWWSRWARGNNNRRYKFDLAGKPLDRVCFPSLEQRFDLGIQQPRRERDMTPLEPMERNAFLTLMRSMLAYQPAERITAKEVLRYEWMVKWALPDFEKMRSS
ncbi:kinase-like domain-containing protein [Penicillium macrosclerotiorum]|uniref:kinase-like domain-containing protein n=1 Tax=Penicillium macrosclerotiorum TaxID=303699 RepID=UPI002548A1B4|nr:kinase-like domain-containing protein [Penicillium macrosclerotiorum]KAJ5688984.1 kinase-like domain-containing protein [Penicillium macrosclerotiorum]